MLRSLQQRLIKPHQSSSLNRVFSSSAALKRDESNHWEPKKRVSRPTMDKMRALNASQPEVYNIVTLSKEFKLSVEGVRRILKSKYVPKNKDDAERQEKNRYEAMGERRKEFKTKHPEAYKKTDAWRREEEKVQDISTKKKNTWTNDTYGSWKKVSDNAKWNQVNDEQRSHSFGRGDDRRSLSKDNDRRSFSRNEDRRSFSRDEDRRPSSRFSERDRRSFSRFDDTDRRSYSVSDERDRRSFSRSNDDDRRSSSRSNGSDRRSYNRYNDEERHSFKRFNSEERRSFSRSQNGERGSYNNNREGGRPFNNRDTNQSYKEGKFRRE